MMIEPPVDQLIKKEHSRYGLVLAVSKRARQLVDGAVPTVDAGKKKPLAIAIEEIYTDKIVAKFPEQKQA